MKTQATTRRKNFVRVIEYRRVRRKRLGRLSDPAKVADLCVALTVFPDDGREYFGVFLLNGANNVFAYHPVAMGTVDASLVSPREVFGPAVRELGCNRVVLVHNHPSGDPEPSYEDIRLTKALVQAGRLLDVHVIDHVILGDLGAYASMAELGHVVDGAHKDNRTLHRDTPRPGTELLEHPDSGRPTFKVQPFEPVDERDNRSGYIRMVNLDAVPKVFEFVDVLPDDHNSFPARACNRHSAHSVENGQHELGQPPRHRLGVGRVAE